MNATRLAALPVNSLAFALQGAAQAVARVEEGVALPQALAEVFLRLSPSDQARGAIQDIAYRTLRQLGQARALLDLLAAQALQPTLLQILLCCALALLCPPQQGAMISADYEAFTVVHQTVEAAAGDAKLLKAKGLVNAILRRFLRERETLLEKIAANPVALWNYPGWWIEAVQAAYPTAWQSILKNGNSLPPLTLRINQRKTNVADFLRILSENENEGMPLGLQAVRLLKPKPVEKIPGFKEGWISVQDAAAQLAASLLDSQPGMRVLDACAAPGGKTCHILEQTHVELTALDCDAQRLSRVADNLQRLQLCATLKIGNAGNKTWWDGQLFDRILADVPCTASGIVRRHPDIRWLRRAEDSQKLARLAATILDNLWTMLKPGGKLLFITCSIWPQESELQAAAFALRQQALRLPAPGQLLPEITEEHNHDGLFYALFHKS